MATKLNELAKIDTNLEIVPAADELSAIFHELKDMGTLPFGRVQIAAAGAGVFKVTEPGEEEAAVATEIVAVIILNHRTNALWLNKYGTTEDKSPDCFSIDGDEGIVRETGECRTCASCRYNQYGSADNGIGRGKACKNTRRLYLMRPADKLRPADIFPVILSLPSTALGAFDKYRTKILLGRRQMHGVLTRITLKNAANKDGIAYSTPVFESVGVLPPEEVERVRQYADGFATAVMKLGVLSEDGESTQALGYSPAYDEAPLPFE